MTEVEALMGTSAFSSSELMEGVVVRRLDGNETRVAKLPKADSSVSAMRLGPT